MSDKERPFNGHKGPFVLNTPSGVFHGHFTDGGLEINEGEPLTLRTYLRQLAMLPITVRQGRRRLQGQEPTTVRRYTDMAAKDRLFAALGEQCGFNPQTMAKATYLRQGGINNPEELVAAPEKVIRDIPGIGGGKRLQDVLTVRRVLEQELSNNGSPADQK